ncbi:hypothetical protein SAMN05444064_11246 [Pseudomonas syringae]|uniref:hypothetical protein n=1 Tax=Pseudomonas syringae TaxID=317 RepID=UPI00089683D3|nr:hypothetical protein [Pseudomonas syringae]SDX08065.1 hypothetical protein SAMN05444514_11146 [Pseudomonas syringae]SFM25679.1 hypothetical protein SAMN05444064_11246 [Pseudomonas syringae]
MGNRAENPLNRIEFALANWAWGSTRSELMCTKLLILGGYADATPQAPRGGPDGGKDIVFTHRLGKGIAACYFPHSAPKFPELKSKFCSDLAKAEKDGARCFFFFTGQRLTMGERIKLANTSKLPVFIYDHDYIVPRYSEISDFIGEPVHASEKNAAKEKSDINCLTMLLKNCRFFNLTEDLERAPYRFGPSIIAKDDLNELFEKKVIHFYEPELSRLVAEWWAAWSKILDLTRWNFDMITGGDIFLPREHHKYKDKNYLAELEAESITLSESHNSLLDHIRSRYPEVFAFQRFANPSIER